DVAQLLELDGRRQGTDLVPRDRPARQDGVADGDPVDRVAAGKDVVEAEIRGDDGGLIPAAVLPDLLERDHVRSERHQRAPDRIEPRLPRTAAPPQIPRHDPQPGLDERAELEEGVRRHLWQAPSPLPGAARSRKRRPTSAAHSTVTLFARLRGWSTSRPRATAAWYARSWSGTVIRMGFSSGSLCGTSRTSSARVSSPSPPAWVSASTGPRRALISSREETDFS